MSFAQKKPRFFLTALILVLGSCFLFLHLGTYALWDDEAETALGAKGVLATGDTTALIGKNIDARRGGINLRNMADRLTPPLPTYITAFSFKLGGENAFFARLPFAVFGLLSILLLLRLLRRTGASTNQLALFAVVLICNVSFFLYFRQDRYYGAALFFGIALGCLYLDGLQSVRSRILYSLVSLLLFFSHPIIFVQAQGIIALDWLIFERARRGLPSLRQLLELSVPCVLLATPCLMVWNPFLVKSKEYLAQVTLSDRVTLLWWNIRDLFAGELVPFSVMICALLAYTMSKNRNILRPLLGLAVIVLVTSLVTYQRVSVTSCADIRYDILAIPLGMALAVISFSELFGRQRILGIAAAFLLVGTNLGSGKILFQPGLDSLPLRFSGELMNPMEEPYTPVATWISQNVPEGSSILVEPDYMMYPLMFHAPNAVYAWQLTDAADPQFAGVAPIHFMGREAPDYVVLFGPSTQTMLPRLLTLFGSAWRYLEVAHLNVLWKDTYRPEIFWRSFQTIPLQDPSQGISIYKKIPAA